MSIIDEQWRFVLHDTDEHVRRIAERASQEPVLRQLFPYPSLSNLRFSRKTEYPYDEMPYVVTVKSDPVKYEARGSDNRHLAEGDLDVVVAAVCRQLSMSDPDPVWELFEILNQRVNLTDQAKRVMDFVLKVCRELARTGDRNLEALLGIGEAAARGAANFDESLAARVRAHALIDRLAGSPREQAAMVCVRYTLPDGNAYDAYELLWQFLHDARAAGMSSADLASILADVFPEVR